jgi:hypothetical protein
MNRGIGKENGNDGLRVLNASGKKIVGVTERGIVNESGSTRYVVDSFSLRWFSHEMAKALLQGFRDARPFA